MASALMKRPPGPRRKVLQRTVLRVAERHNQRTVWQHRLKVERRRVAEIQKKSHPRE